MFACDSQSASRTPAVLVVTGLGRVEVLMGANPVNLSSSKWICAQDGTWEEALAKVKLSHKMEAWI